MTVAMPRSQFTRVNHHLKTFLLHTVSECVCTPWFAICLYTVMFPGVSSVREIKFLLSSNIL